MTWLKLIAASVTVIVVSALQTCLASNDYVLLRSSGDFELQIKGVPVRHFTLIAPRHQVERFLTQRGKGSMTLKRCECLLLSPGNKDCGLARSMQAAIPIAIGNQQIDLDGTSYLLVEDPLVFKAITATMQLFASEPPRLPPPPKAPSGPLTKGPEQGGSSHSSFGFIPACLTNSITANRQRLREDGNADIVVAQGQCGLEDGDDARARP